MISDSSKIHKNTLKIFHTLDFRKVMFFTEVGRGIHLTETKVKERFS